MNISNLNRNVLAAVVGTVLAAGTVAPASAQSWRERHAAQGQSATTQQDSEDAREARRKEREEREAAAKARAEAASAREAGRQRDQAQAQRGQQREFPRDQQQRESDQRERELAGMREQQESIREQNRQTRERNDRVEREQAQAQREQARGERERERERGDMAQARERQQSDRQSERQERDNRQAERQQQREQRQDNRHADLPPPRRLENRQRDQRIVREKQQAQTFQQAVQTQIAPAAKSYANTLHRQHRSHGYSYQQQYYWRLLQMLTAWHWQRYNYWNDPYFYTADDYRYYRGGSWYSINRYGADILRQAINYGYQEGFYAGRADRLDGWRFDYRNAWVYRDANYGYRGFYVSQFEYNYYFRQGFRRGYEDGYYQRYRYGRHYNGSDVILGTVLSGILSLQAYRW